ncbi:hypothetical protein NEOLI_001701 [Neolecta irregularis DAH-3]|uniref:Transcription factor domain-containing protein n=1 Tax=Neolecta irregularis (strain DAH-3) TaxID=1198029 RepID=A0A1U7LGF4_NEOID|nr:hypothetical protein NEOLI_001701 [Neolecta irregularis DAH-3]|eukprot:OLL21734.1 hypothetical protein NEOLI_001701 [Neolecta irregularis DAH-3]
MAFCSAARKSQTARTASRETEPAPAERPLYPETPRGQNTEDFPRGDSSCSKVSALVKARKGSLKAGGTKTSGRVVKRSTQRALSILEDYNPKDSSRWVFKQNELGGQTLHIPIDLPSSPATQFDYCLPFDSPHFSLSSFPGGDPKYKNQISFFMAFHVKYITHFHHFVDTDEVHFFSRTILAMAETSQPLLYSRVAFSALLYSVTHDINKLEYAMMFYHLAVNEIMEGLRSPAGTKGQEYFLLAAVLSLALYEEYLADFVKWYRHLAGACRIITDTGTPHSWTSNPIGRALLSWLSHMDASSALIAAKPPLLDEVYWLGDHKAREKSLTEKNPPDIIEEIAYAKSRLRHVILQTAKLAACAVARTLTPENILHQIKNLDELCLLWYHELPPELLQEDAPETVTVNYGCPIQPVRYKHWQMGVSMLDYWTVRSYLLQISTPVGASFSKSSTESTRASHYAFKICQIVAGLDSPDLNCPSVLVAIAHNLCVAAICLTNDLDLRSWVRCLFDKVERLGLSFGDIYRHRLAELWNDTDLRQGWLEGLSDMSLRRNSTAQILQEVREINDDEDDPNDSMTEIKHLRGTFAGVEIGS